MIRFEYVLRRKPGMSIEEFQDYWLNTHGPLVAKLSTAMGVSRYAQLHTIADDPRHKAMQESRGLMEPCDGVAELWWYNTPPGTKEAQAASEELLEDDLF